MASISIPTVAGTVQSSFENNQDGFILRVTLPRKTQAVVCLPLSAAETVIINRKRPSKSVAKVAPEYKKDHKLCYQLPAGEYTIGTKK